MNSYNIAVTVGPNIFRPLTVRPADLFNAGTYYDVVIRMMENYEILFEGAPMPRPDTANDLLMQAAALHGGTDSVGMKLGGLGAEFGGGGSGSADNMPPRQQSSNQFGGAAGSGEL